LRKEGGVGARLGLKGFAAYSATHEDVTSASSP
jgi:hypothetical protein